MGLDVASAKDAAALALFVAVQNEMQAHISKASGISSKKFLIKNLVSNLKAIRNAQELAPDQYPILTGLC